MVTVNSLHYVAGNAANGNGTVLSELSDNTRVRTLNLANATQTVGAYNTSAVGLARGTDGSATGHQRGFPATDVGAAATKTGKGDNFRSFRVFNNDLCTLVRGKE